MEDWVKVKGYGEKYEVSNQGRVKKIVNGAERFVALNKNSCGYLQLHLYDGSVRKTITVHRLVATHFIPNPENLPQINHKDGNKDNNAVSNLEWCTARENTKHAYDTGLKELTRKKASITAKKRLKEVVAAHVEKSSKPIEITEISTGKVTTFGSANEAARCLGIYQGNLSAVCNGRIKSTAGYTARYLEVNGNE